MNVWFGLRLKGLASKDPRPKAEAIAFAAGYVTVPRSRAKIFRLRHHPVYSF
jgi:hypothetical protein